jgi:hypothetical protein
MAQATFVGIKKKTFYFSHESVLSSSVCLLDTGMHQCWGGSLNFKELLLVLVIKNSRIKEWPVRVLSRKFRVNELLLLVISKMLKNQLFS